MRGEVEFGFGDIGQVAPDRLPRRVETARRPGKRETDRGLPGLFINRRGRCPVRLCR